MIKLNRTTEYGLMAISYIRGKSQGEISSAREIADSFDLPFEILAKTLQKLKDVGVITSTYGTRGGYVLNRDLKTLNLAEFLTLMEGPISVVSCAQASNDKSDEAFESSQPARPSIIPSTNDLTTCAYMGNCNIHPMMSALNSRFYDFLNRISVDELTRQPHPMNAVIPFSSPSALSPVALQGEEP